MKKINLLSLVQALNSLQQDGYLRFLNHYEISVKNDEVKDLGALLTVLCAMGVEKTIFDHFYVGYKIPQIGKEFDLLRFGMGCVLNIELKRTSTKEKVEKQLRRNKYYLSFLGGDVHNFCFVSEAGSLFALNAEGQLVAAEFASLIAVLKAMQVNRIDNVDDLFDPSNYLVSPFNSTQKFVGGEYFLTLQQEKIVGEIMGVFNLSTSATYVSIKGSAGTGKTLLVYDIAKRLMVAGKSTLVIHCGNLNDGQLLLKTNHGWHIAPIKYFRNYDFSDYDLVVIDEAQRIRQSQLDDIIQTINEINGLCIFSYDKFQTLAEWEENRNIDGLVSAIPPVATYALTEKIRTNKEIASFIKGLFSNKANAKLLNRNNIELNYFDNETDAKDYLSSLSGHGWEVLRFTPSQHNNEHHQKYSDVSSESSHKVIGQEFDCVAVTIDKYFSYDAGGNLIYTGYAYYDPVKMLFQNITRTRKRLNVVIINNSILFDRCASVLEG